LDRSGRETVIVVPFDLWVFGRQLQGTPCNGEVVSVSGGNRRLAEYLESLDPAKRQEAFEGFLKSLSQPDENDLTGAMAAINPNGPPPPIDSLEVLTAAELRAIVANLEWHWSGWIAARTIIGFAAEQGTGKTRFALDVCSRIYNELVWPDGQPMTLPKGSRTLWLCADGQEAEILSDLPKFGIPDDAFIFTGRTSDPGAHQSLDDPETFRRIDELIIARRPVILFVDSVSYATQHDLCEMRVIASLKPHLLRIVQTHGITIILLMHTNAAGKVFGRHIKGITRSLIQMECPDPEQPERLRLWVERAIGKKPLPLGVTMHDKGNDYDHNPPAPPEPGFKGRPSDKRDKAKELILLLLGEQDDRVGNDMRDKFVAAKLGSSETFWRAVRELAKKGKITTSGGPGTGGQEVLHLVNIGGSTQTP
jgi:hypothetical protein